jgi:hypothetical protein
LEAAFFFLATVRPPKKVSARSASVTSKSRVTLSESCPEQKQRSSPRATSQLTQQRPYTRKFRKELHVSCTHFVQMCNTNFRKSCRLKEIFFVTSQMIFRSTSCS